MGSTSQPARVRISLRAAEAVMISMACLAPWAFGAVEAWAELAIDIGVALIALLGFIAGRGVSRADARPDIPSLALVGLGLLALAQAAPMPEGLVRLASPATAMLRAQVLPRTPERVLTDTGPVVPLPPHTLGQDPEAALGMAMKLAAAWLLFQGVLGLEPGYGPIRRFAVATAVNATLMALFSLIQVLTWNGKIYWLRHSPLNSSAGPFVSHNHLAAYLNLGLGFAAAFLLAPRPSGPRAADRHSRLWWMYSVGILVIAIVASLSRNGFLCMIVVLAVLVLMLRPKAWQLFTGLGMAGLLVILLVSVLGESVPYRDRLATLLGSRAFHDRLWVWRSALPVLSVYPLLGSGLGSFPVTMIRFLQARPADLVFVCVHAENEYLEWLVEGGVVGLGLVLLGLAGVATLARRALRAATPPENRTLVLGACSGGVAILVESLGDFALHIPGVAVSVVILAAHLTKLGLEARDRGLAQTPPTPRDAAALLASLTRPVLGMVLVVQAIGLARSEAVYRASGRPWPGTGTAASQGGGDAIARLGRERAAIERSLALRPNWAEGYQELGFVLLELYKEQTAEGLRGSVPDPAERDLLSSHLWLHLRVHAPAEDRPLTQRELLDLPPVKSALVPAARAFLQARRCSPFLPMPHAQLAALDRLLGDAEPADVLIARALPLCGADVATLMITERLAAQIGDLDLAARIQRQTLIATERDWVPVADRAAALLSADKILSGVVPDGRFAILFGEYLYGAPEHRALRERFLREGIRRLPSDHRLSRAARLHLEARAWRGLGDRDRAVRTMELALGAAPKQAFWRKELVEWLIQWDELDRAHTLARVGLELTPDSAEAREAFQASVSARARKAAPPERRQ